MSRQRPGFLSAFLQFRNLLGVGVKLGWFLGFTYSFLGFSFLSFFFLSFAASRSKDKSFPLSLCRNWRRSDLGFDVVKRGLFSLSNRDLLP